MFEFFSRFFKKKEPKKVVLKDYREDFVSNCCSRHLLWEDWHTMEGICSKCYEPCQLVEPIN